MCRNCFVIVNFMCALALQAQTPVVTNGGVVNGASFSTQAVAPGSLVAIFGSSLAAGTAAADTIPVSNTLGAVSVSFNNIPAPLLFVSPGQINAQMPWDVVPAGGSGTVQVVVTNNGVPSAPQQVNIGPVGPGIFNAAVSGKQMGIAVNSADGTLAWPSGVVAGSHPVKAGDVIIVYATGLGAVDPPITSGHNDLAVLHSTTQTPVITIGGVPAVVGFSGMAPQFVGVNQLNIVVPPGVTPGTAALQVQFGNIKSSDQVIIAVQ
jgi:uncharacterized protein (TIGR03437 family)